ncbi:MAG: ParB N-terminal domain-containing protein [Gemmataceae bacterium]|nr:ParB N-terminal domain-containing protein [Gemmataceae bacterium]
MNTIAQYYILAGVRRAVAAREAGWKDLPARIVEAGYPDVLTRVGLDQLHSPKPEVIRDHRYIRNTEYPTKMLGTQPPAIEIEQLGLPNQGPSIPIAQVILR